MMNKLYINTPDTTPTDSKKAVALDDMILTADIATTGGSKMLDGYKSLFEAEAVTRLKAAGYTISGKANVGEFSLDLLGETSYYGAVLNEGGELALAASELVRTGAVGAALSVDLNGSPRRGAALAGVTYIKPTYGLVSRYGIIPTACSGESLGITATDAEKCAEILKTIGGHDDKDGTSLSSDLCDFTVGSTVKGIKIAISEALLAHACDETKENIEKFSKILEAAGAEISKIDGSELLMAQSAWNILSAAEICNNLSRYDGVKFGYRSSEYTNIDELYTNSRTESLGLLAKTIILYGSDVLSQARYMPAYDKALRIRRVLCEYLEKLFADYDMILLPACSRMEYKPSDIGDSIETTYAESLFTAPASVTGMPAMVTGGVQLLGKAFSEKNLLAVASVYDKEAAK